MPKTTVQAADDARADGEPQPDVEVCLQERGMMASRCEPFKSWHGELLARGLRPDLARVTVARRIAAITLAVWKRGEAFDAGKLIGHAA
jgi:hypothetical protein